MAAKPSFTIESEGSKSTPIVVTSSRDGGLYITQGTSWVSVPADACEDFIDVVDKIFYADGDDD